MMDKQTDKRNPAFGKWTEKETNWSSVDDEFIKDALKEESIPTSYEELKRRNDMKRAQEIFNSDKSPLDFMVESGGSVGYASSVCERCGKKFRFYRKEHLIYDRTAHKYHAFKQVCIDCINLKSDSF